jgi:hypothetical protein
VAFWDRIGRALQGFGDWLTRSEERPPEPAESPFAEPPGPVEEEYDPFYEEPVPEYEQAGFGDFWGTGEERDPDEAFIYLRDGPYPDNWEAREIEFWNEVAGDRAFENEANYEDAQAAFERGFMTQGLSKEEREYYRSEFLENMDMAYFEDWEDFRDYWEEISPPG